MPHRGLAYAVAAAFLLFPILSGAKGPDFRDSANRVRKLLQELVAANTENPPGNEARAVAIGAERLRGAGVPYQVFEFAPGRANLIARLKGNGSAKPLLLLAHVDVVPTAGQPWSVSPHQVTERGDRLFGRGVLDDLSMAAAELEVILLLKAAGTPLRRDVILAWTGGEETGGDGIRWQLQHHPETLGDAGLAFNEGGGLRLGSDGTVKEASLLVAEKIYQDFTIRTTGTSGHSSAPRPDNAIYRLARALDRLAHNPFPARLLPVTRKWFEAAAATEEPRVAEAMRAIATSKGALPEAALEVISAKPAMVALLRTTCVPTQLAAGTGRNVLPAEATANVNCRILPDQGPEEVRLALVETIADAGVDVVPVDKAIGGKASPLVGEGPAALRTVLGRLYPGVPLIPKMVNYFTDSRSLVEIGVTAYGVGLFPATEQDGLTVHAADERLPTASLRPGIELLHALVTELAAGR
ncbi:MAG TPA: M20/M25/M40 family metallo-hydrolase [Anaeromyxobacteraceae bacterium]|nr:M20/M25/M40 family metallo-hydrolase [Anaeromyxobacteraceae bacterium]